MTVTTNSHQPVIEQLKGRTLTIPDLVALVYPDWKVKNHENEAEIREEMENDFLERWCPDSTKRAKLKKGNFAQQAGFFWSGCPLERLRPLAQFIYWFFIWDDGIYNLP
ncbi:hypothetical protein HFD88_000858 [Aspergillus terreus]|nr:hypothetical protein HFD88_000858 [Aspergillus terreus]